MIAVKRISDFAIKSILPLSGNHTEDSGLDVVGNKRTFITHHIFTIEPHARLNALERIGSVGGDDENAPGISEDDALFVFFLLQAFELCVCIKELVEQRRVAEVLNVVAHDNLRLLAGRSNHADNFSFNTGKNDTGHRDKVRLPYLCATHHMYPFVWLEHNRMKNLDLSGSRYLAYASPL